MSQTTSKTFTDKKSSKTAYVPKKQVGFGRTSSLQELVEAAIIVPSSLKKVAQLDIYTMQLIANVEKDFVSSPTLEDASLLGSSLRQNGISTVQQTMETTMVIYVEGNEVLASIQDTTLVSFEECTEDHKTIINNSIKNLKHH